MGETVFFEKFQKDPRIIESGTRKAHLKMVA
jgi:hypothetical protein